jgi:hypothetical protein
MPFDPSLSSSVDRVRLAVGDVDDVEWLADATYLALLSDAADDLDTATRLAASALYSIIAMEPVRRTANGEVIDYSGRLPRLKALAAGEDATPATPASPPRFDLVGSSNVTTEAHW